MVKKLPPSVQVAFVENSYVQMSVSEGLIFKQFKKNTVLDLAAAQHIESLRLKMSNGRVMPILVDIKNLISVDVSARRWLASEEALAYLSAGAYLIDNVFNSLFFNTFLRLDNPKIPLRSFLNETAAFRWLEKFKEPQSKPD